MPQSNNMNQTQSDIMQRLAYLTKWQQDQKKLLDQRQQQQRQMLGLEQRNMYQKLGIGLLQSAEETVPESETQNDESIEEKIYESKIATQNKLKYSKNILSRSNHVDDDEIEEEQQKENFEASSFYNDNERQQRTKATKRPFLKRGEGLKQRFKIDPEKLRLNNLPPYKYANSHKKFAKLPQINLKETNLEIGTSKPNNDDDAAQLTPLDAQEKRFQQLLFSSKNHNSTPDKSFVSSSATSMPRICSTELLSTYEKQVDFPSYDLNSIPKPISWSQVLDSQKIKPIPVHQMRAHHNEDSNMGDNTSVVQQQQEDDDTLNIFELLEQKAIEGNIDMNSSCIKRFMERKLQLKLDEVDLCDIPVNSRLRDAHIKPVVQEVLNDDDEFSTNSENNYEQPKDSENSELSPVKPIRPGQHVRFSEDNSTYEYVNNDEESESSAFATDAVDTTLCRSSDLFEQFKAALLSALQSNAEKGHSDMSIPSNPSEHTNDFEIPLTTVAQPCLLSEDLQEKTNLIKARLVELEQEISSFKQNNLELLKAKQLYELEKAHFNQERLEIEESMSNEKIQLEIYLHDERMKIEEEKRKFEQHMRTRKSPANSKDRKEIERLTQQLEAVQQQIKQKDQAHVAAQGRLRAQLRNLEKDQKQLYDEVERLNKENKRLQNENIKLSRQSNNRMLDEINRNIAKLAPKLANNASCNSLEATTASIKNSALSSAANRLTASKGSSKTNNQRKQKHSIATKSTSIQNIVDSSESEDARSVEEKEDDICAQAEDKQEKITNELQVQTSIANVQSTTKVESSNNTANKEFKREIINSDGSKDIWYPNGNLKKISADAMIIRMLYFNKDIKETNINEGTIKYYYADSNIWHTTYLDGLEILEFPNGQTEHRYKNGTIEVHFPNNSIKVTNPTDEHKLEEWRYADGTTLIQMRNGDKILTLPNGQKEIHTKLSKRREYPDGTVKLVYPDGSQETRYSNGRLRLKDKDGKLVLDVDGK